VFILSFTLIVTCLSDYLSLLETRWVIRKMGHSSLSRIIRLLALDSAASFLIGLLGVAVATQLFYYLLAIALGFPIADIIPWRAMPTVPPDTPEPFREMLVNMIKARQSLIEARWAMLRMPAMEGYQLICTVLGFSPMAGWYPSPGIWFYATFFTTFWSLLYVAASLLLKTAAVVWPLRWFVDVDQNPLISLGIVAVVFVFVSTLAVSVCYWIVSALR
jgi:hypothetical protein